MIVIKRQTPSSARLEFRWKGGAYVDVFWVGGEIPDHTDISHHGAQRGEDDNAPFTNINVYDYATGKPDIDIDDPDAETQLAKRVDEWITWNSSDYGFGA